jgi:hypothetical protein
MGKAKVKKKIKGFEKQFEVHQNKLSQATKKGNVGLIRYYEKELENFQKNIDKLIKRKLPKKKRKKV